MIQPEGMGRDRFEKLAREEGFNVPCKRSFIKTTNSLGVTRFPNLVDEIELTHVNQVWVSDITYYWLQEKFMYITLIMDLYSRYIVGYSLSKNLQTVNTTIPALKRALQLRGKDTFDQDLILHSDGGGQFYSKDLLKITRQYVILNSMAYDVYENPHAERVIGTIKNDYLIPYEPKDENQLARDLKKTINLYNKQRPHSSLGMLSPLAFETPKRALSTEKLLV
jgi:transposase InsO family protein